MTEEGQAMLLIADDRTTYNTATMTHINLSTVIINNPETLLDETWYQVCINYGKMFNGLASEDVAYQLCKDLDETKISNVELKIIEAIKNRTPVLDIQDVLIEVQEEML